MDFWPDVTDEGRDSTQDFIAVRLEVGLRMVIFSCISVPTPKYSFFSLELLLSLQAVLFNFSWSAFFAPLQPPVLPLAGLRHPLSLPLVGPQQLPDALPLAGCGDGHSEAKVSGLNWLDLPLGSPFQTSDTQSYKIINRCYVNYHVPGNLLRQ